MGPVTADTDPTHDDRLRTANYTGFQHPAMVFFCSHPGSGYHTSQALTISPAARSRGAAQRSYSGTRIASRQAVLQMLESKGRWQIPLSGGFCTDIDLAANRLTSDPIHRLQIIAIPPFT
jgi:hypothetical protein